MNINDVVEVFNNYYGEENVDYNADEECIYIYWNEIEIENEYKEKIKIYDFYAKIGILCKKDSVLYQYLYFIKASYTESQFYTGYIHSHISTLHGLPYFKSMCLGTGPIKNTIAKLMLPKNEIEDWMLFAWELDKTIRVESVEGTPYIRLKSVNNRIGYNIQTYIRIVDNNVLDLLNIKTNSLTETRFYNEILNSFVPFIFKNNLFKFSFLNKEYKLGMNYNDYLIKLSNLFIEWYNNQDIAFKKLYNKDFLDGINIFTSAVYKDGNIKILTNNYSDSNFNNYIGTFLFKFKGKDVVLKKVKEDDIDNYIKIFLYNNLPIKLLYRVLRILNTNYGTERNTTNKKTRVF